MTKKELLQEKAKIDFFLTSSSKTSSNVEAFYTSLGEYFEEEYSKKLLPLTILKAKVDKTLYKNITTFCEEIDDWLDSVLKRSVHLHERMRIYQITIELIGKYIIDCKGVVSVKRIVDSRDNFPGVIEKAFPGYIKSGLVDLILNAKLHKYDEEDLI
jgi:hypothetical protein